MFACLCNNCHLFHCSQVTPSKLSFSLFHDSSTQCNAYKKRQTILQMMTQRQEDYVWVNAPTMFFFQILWETLLTLFTDVIIWRHLTNANLPNMQTLAFFAFAIQIYAISLGACTSWLLIIKNNTTIKKYYVFVIYQSNVKSRGYHETSPT